MYGLADSLRTLTTAFPTNVAVALLAALTWGGGDFSGGMGVKAAGNSTAGALRLVIVAHALSLAVLLSVLFAKGAVMPLGAPAWWGLAAGVAGGVSLTAFYMALARGAMGASAALSGVIAAAIPALVSARVEGRPHSPELAGFALAGVAIWIIAASPASASGGSRATSGLALVGGFGFGIYFVALRFANPLGVLEPMLLARIGSLVTCSALLLLLRTGVHTPRGAEHTGIGRQFLGWAVGVAVLDTAGNLLFTWSTRLGRLDVAAVLASLYPASTILLAAWRLHERPTSRQWMGMGLALAAVVLISL